VSTAFAASIRSWRYLARLPHRIVCRPAVRRRVPLSSPNAGHGASQVATKQPTQRWAEVADVYQSRSSNRSRARGDLVDRSNRLVSIVIWS
jgi:hypothetical protein